MTKKIIAGGCSFTLGNELSDDKDGKTPSNKSWAKLLTGDSDYVCTAFGGLGNSAIARRTFNAVSQNPDVAGVIVIIWLQNILEKKKIPFMFTLADNSLFYNEFEHLKDQDSFMNALHGEIDLTKWFSFGERMMGFNQWSVIEEYERGTTHPLDKAHQDAVQLMLPTFNKLIGEE